MGVPLLISRAKLSEIIIFTREYLYNWLSLRAERPNLCSIKEKFFGKFKGSGFASIRR